MPSKLSVLPKNDKQDRRLKRTRAEERNELIARVQEDAAWDKLSPKERENALRAVVLHILLGPNVESQQ